MAELNSSSVKMSGELLSESKWKNCSSLTMGKLTPKWHDPYLEPFSFEKFDVDAWTLWMRSNWYLSIYASIVYLILVRLGIKWMENRKPFELRGALVLWNLFLSFASWFMFFRIYPELFSVIYNFGFYASFCNIRGHTIPSAFWTLAFTFSKIVEFGDTAFIVFRKQKLILLHWYHHITVAMYTCYTYSTFDPACRYFGTMNSFVHGVMYGYYAMRAMGIKIPRNVSKSITSLQLLQMFIGLAVNGVTLMAKVSQNDCCDRPMENIIWALAMYGSYTILFIDFFRKSYSLKVRTDANRNIKDKFN